MTSPFLSRRRNGDILRLAPRGKVLRLDGAPSDAPSRPSASALEMDRRSGLVVGAALFLGLPLFAQFFHYMIDVKPLYYLSKAWPFLTLPLAFYGAQRSHGRTAMLFLATLAYFIGVTPLLSMVWLGNTVVDAFATTVKVWPITYFFSLQAVFLLVRPSPASLRRALLVLGTTTFLLLWALWIFVPHSDYSADPSQSKLLMYDFERGYRVVPPLIFALMQIFYVTHRMMQKPRFWHALFLAFGFASMVLINKQRLQIVMAAAVVAWIVVSRLPRLWRTVTLVLGGIAGSSGGLWLALHVDRVVGSLGNSLAIRQTSLALIWHFLLDQPLRWVFGAGGTTRFGSTTLFAIMGDRDFYLADLGWPGVIFEYGVAGSLLLMLIYLVALPRKTKEPRGGGPDAAIAAAAGSYGLFLLLVTAVYSPVLTPGELAAVVAIQLFLAQAGRTAPPAATDAG